MFTLLSLVIPLYTVDKRSCFVSTTNISALCITLSKFLRDAVLRRAVFVVCFFDAFS